MMKTDELYKTLMQLVNFFNDPKQDQLLLQAAQVNLDAKLFPLFVRIAQQPAISVGELAKQLNRPHSTISRQVDRLLQTKLIEVMQPTADGRKRQLTLSQKGHALNQQINQTRQNKLANTLAMLPTNDQEKFIQLLDTFASALQQQN